MFYNRKSHIGICDDPRYGGEWEGKEVIVRPLPMGQEIYDAMREHPDKDGERRSIEHSRQGDPGTDNHKRMHTDCNNMQRRVVQESMDFRHKRRLRHMFQIMRYKAQR